MTARRSSELRPGYGDHVTVRSSTSGRTWSGIVLVWSLGCPFVSDDETAATRWYPSSWIETVVEGNGPGPCGCYVPHPSEEGDDAHQPHIDPDCPDHGDPAAVASAILRKARTKP